MNPTPPTIDAPERRALARLLCEQHGGDPDAVASEPHDCWEGPLWTAFTTDSDAILALLAASSGEREKALEDAAEVVVGLRSRCGVETFTDRAQRQILMIAEEKIRALATPATEEEPKV